MPQVSQHPLAKHLQQKIAQIFLETIVKTNSKSKASRLVQDLLTPTERVMISKRLAIAYLLERHWPYRSISDTLKVSTTTIARIENIRKSTGHGLRTPLAAMLDDPDIVRWFNQLEAIVSALPPKNQGGATWQQRRQQHN